MLHDNLIFNLVHLEAFRSIKTSQMINEEVHSTEENMIVEQSQAQKNTNHHPHD